MDLYKEGTRLVNLASIFVWTGWIGVAFALIAGLIWWMDLASGDAFDFLEAPALTSAAVVRPLFTAIVLAAVGHALRLFAIDAASQSGSE